MKSNNTIALLTDFGYADTYVGVMKAVLLRINPEARLIDLNHNIEPQNVKQAAFDLLISVEYFPEGTTFLCGVDPGVGSARSVICANTMDYNFVAPNNGLLSYVLDAFQAQNIIIANKSEYYLDSVSNTFHGRDVLAPLAGYLSSGGDIEELGREAEPNEVVRLKKIETTTVCDDCFTTEILKADRFGNIITSTSQDYLHGLGKLEQIVVEVSDYKVKGISKTYSDVGIGEAVAYIGSSGYLEVGLRDGNLWNRISRKPGEVKLRIFK